MEPMFPWLFAIKYIYNALGLISVCKMQVFSMLPLGSQKVYSQQGGLF